MIPVQLNPDEAAMLHKILLSYLSDLRVEIASMDIEGFNEVLKKEEESIENLLRRLESENLAYPEAMFGDYE